ncbi:isoaspartyl peptidase/L-asparaginase family protein [Streptomyces spectabilis]|uniref:Beta-aspartyl-peptidase (Threonine type) n=1 Tax=Streptomyces spectabilis TaxID=68270 RepID=A0A5P2X3V9_STRST|nr:isoaspartyl peptidase/L-asparaginase [Streptomyces spectabilis]MBB5101698.1 beta-aspartyl-peptidase (threonine type) [Streptomyces spectabilis]MCI3900880.1 isoaspartyl peptidase/L-asparaginase [Streptomyces spectabilis]QEV58394.1 isoaspartyl peptidase/L-asparaginase [Streptomyces spectabilis]GGV49689.1 L-asparaginase [Streptomyces spectabilis]
MRIRPLTWLIPALATAAAVTATTLALPRGGERAPEDRAAAAADARPTGKARPDARNVVLAVHGGAGTALDRDKTTPEREKAYRDGLTEALRAGRKVLDKGGSSVDAVQAAVTKLEDNPLFNAGKGAVFTADAGHELDASIMRGSDLKAGAVAGVKSLRNPIEGARAVMDESKHVLLAGEGADDFGARQGLRTVTQDYYWTQARWDALMAAKEAEKGGKGAAGPAGDSPAALADAQSKGTVGAVAVDKRRDLAAATSTGGLTNKLPGRVGDSPLIGAGTYAKNGTVAASATGAGEVFIRGAATATLSHLMEFKGVDVAKAAYEVIVKRLPALGGDGGVIALAPDGEFDAPHSSPGMLHGYLTEDGKVVTKIFPDETPPNS